MSNNKPFPKRKSKVKKLSKKNVVAKVKEKRYESEIQDRLHAKLGGQREVVIENVGVIDLLTKRELIEVKCVRLWKAAFGQVMIYGLPHPNHRKRIHLFGDATPAQLKEIRKSCKPFGVKVTWEI